MKNIIGINAFHGDSSAVLIRDGEFVCGIEEERLNRKKHWAGFPEKSIHFCLEYSNLAIEDIDVFAINRSPKANLSKKIIFTLKKRPSLNLLVDRIRNRRKIIDIPQLIGNSFSIPISKIKDRIEYVEHHAAHLGSAFFVSPFEQAAVVSVDGFGDFVGLMCGVGQGNQIDINHRTHFPHSLGLFYTAMTQYLGFPHYGDEYKVMGLAAYGSPKYVDKLEEVVSICDDGLENPLFKLNLKYFNHASKGVEMSWEDGIPDMGDVYSDKLIELLGPPRPINEELTEFYKDIAASTQALYEKCLFHILNTMQKSTGMKNLALAGGCGMNSLANGKIYENTNFENIFNQPASGDSGGALGAAYWVWNQINKKPRGFIMQKSYFGPEYSNAEVKAILQKNEALQEKKYSVTERSEERVIQKTVDVLMAGGVVGWFQGRMEWGARALGNRSILGDPRRVDLQNILNLKIKRRESFRPFAPSILFEHVNEYFKTTHPDPFMMKVYEFVDCKKESIPAVVHQDGTGRLQTVRKEDNSRYWNLINCFYEKSGVPILVNTSFNENEPIVCNPQEALNCFLRTKMDLLVINDFIIERLQD